jgi:hypothetical protein
MVLHMMGVVQLRNHTEGRAYYDRKLAAGKSPNEAMRCLKRRLSDIVYRAMLDDYVAAKATGPGGHRGATHQSSAAGSHPHTSTSDKPLHGPVTTKPTTTRPKASWHRREPDEYARADGRERRADACVGSGSAAPRACSDPWTSSAGRSRWLRRRH